MLALQPKCQRSRKIDNHTKQGKSKKGTSGASAVAGAVVLEYSTLPTARMAEGIMTITSKLVTDIMHLAADATTARPTTGRYHEAPANHQTGNDGKSRVHRFA